MTTSSADNNENWKISASIVVTLSEENRYLCVKEWKNAQVLIVPRKARNLLRSLNVDRYPKVFVILFDYALHFSHILRLLISKFKNRPLLVQLQLKTEKSLTFYIKRQSEFRRVQSASLSDGTAEILLVNLKTSLMEVNLSQLTSGIITHQHIIDIGDDFCFRLLNLYDDRLNAKMKSEIFLSVIESDKFNFFLAFLNAFEDEFEKEGLDYYTSEKIRECLEHFMQAKDVKNFKIAIRFLSGFQLYTIYDFNRIFSHVMQFALENKYYEIYGLLESDKITYCHGAEFNVLHFAVKFGLTDLFLKVIKSMKSEFISDPYTFRLDLKDFFRCFEQIENFKYHKIVNVELVFQEALIDLLSNKRWAKALIEDSNLISGVTSYGFESNIQFLYAKLNEHYTPIQFKGRLKNSLIDSARCNLKIDSVRLVWEIIERHFTEAEIHEFVIQEKYSYQYSGALFSVAAQHAKSPEIIAFIWQKINKYVPDNEELKHLLLPKHVDQSNGLIKSKRNENSFSFLLEVYCEHFELKDFIYETNINNENFYQSVICYGSTLMVEFASNLLKERLSSDELRDFMMIKEPVGKNLFHYATLNEKSNDLVIFLAGFIESEFGVDELKKMLSESDISGKLPFNNSVSTFRHLQTLENVASVYQANFPFEELMKLLCPKKVAVIHFIQKAKICEHGDKYLKCMFCCGDRYDSYWNFGLVESFLKKYFDPMISYYIELVDLMTAEGASCDELLSFWKNIEGKNDILTFLLVELKLLYILKRFDNSKYEKFTFIKHKVETFLHSQ